MGAGPILLGVLIAANTPAPVEIWNASAHSGQAQRLEVAIEKVFKRSSRFTLSPGQKPGTIYVTIAESIDWKLVNGRTTVSASIGFAHAPPNAPQELVGKVNCWDDDMSACAKDAVALAVQFAEQKKAR